MVGGRCLRNGGTKNRMQEFILPTEELKGFLTILSKTSKLHSSSLPLFVFIVGCRRRHRLSLLVVTVCPFCSSLSLLLVVFIFVRCLSFVVAKLIVAFLIEYFVVVVCCGRCVSFLLVFVDVIGCCTLSFFVVVVHCGCGCCSLLLLLVTFVVCRYQVDCCMF